MATERWDNLEAERRQRDRLDVPDDLLRRLPGLGDDMDLDGTPHLVGHDTDDRHVREPAQLGFDLGEIDLRRQFVPCHGRSDVHLPPLRP